MNIIGLIKGALTVGVGIVKLFSGGKKPSVAEAIPHAVGLLMPAVSDAIHYGGMDTKDKFDAWLLSADQYTGADPGAVDLVPSLPPDKEEELFDALITACRIYGYMLIGVPGYTVPPQP